MPDFMIVDATIWKLQFTYCYKPHLNFVTTMTSPQQPPYPKYFQKLHSNILHLLRNMVKFGSIVLKSMKNCGIHFLVKNATASLLRYLHYLLANAI